MLTMKIAPNVYAEYYMNGNDIVVSRVYRDGTTFNDPRMIELAKWTIRGVNDGWVKIR